GYSISMNDVHSRSSPSGCMKPVSCTCLPSSSWRYLENVGLYWRSSVVSETTDHGNALTPLGSIWGRGAWSSLVTSGRDDFVFKTPAEPSCTDLSSLSP